MNNELIYQIALKYNLQVKEIQSPQKGYRNTSYPIVLQNGDKLNLIIYKNEPGILERIKRTNLISDYLASQGFLTRKTQGEIIKIGIANSELGMQNLYCCIYNYLEGETIPWEGYTKMHIKLLGQTMSEMHLVMANIEFGMVNEFPEITKELSELNSEMFNYFSNENVKRAMEEKLDLKINLKIFEYFEKLINQIKQLPNPQILHMDFVRSNILFQISNSKFKIQKLSITGILDFEKAAFGPKIVDIARTLAFLIVDCKYKDEQKVRKYFLHSGYKKRGKSDIKNIKFLNPLVNFFLVHDLYKFLAHNPYEFLHENEHFTRTKVKLIQEKFLTQL